VSQSDQSVLDRGAQADSAVRALDATLPGADGGADGERAARRTLRAQVGRLERQLSAIVADRFPYISAASGPEELMSGGEEPSCLGPSLLGLDELERMRDRMAARVQELRHLAAERDEHERRAHELLRQMQLEPGRYRFARLPVSDLGQGGCGVWQVRPRLGLIGMLAGWWQLKLSSGDPALELRAGESHLVCALEGAHVLRAGAGRGDRRAGRGHRGCGVHFASPRCRRRAGRGAQHAYSGCQKLARITPPEITRESSRFDPLPLFPGFGANPERSCRAL
jgi:hypothetical protein